jgi:hypothetical protein
MEAFETFRIIYDPKKPFIEIWIQNMIETKWPSRLWPKMQPILDAQKRSEEALDISSLVRLGGGGKSRKRQYKKRSRSRKYVKRKNAKLVSNIY